MSRPDIGPSTVHRLLTNATNMRVSSEAANAAREALIRFLRKAGQSASDRLKIAKRKTVNREVAEAVLVNECIGLNSVSLKYSKGGQRGLPLAGVRRVFSHEGTSGKKSTGLGFNISKDAEKMVVAAAESFLDLLGKRARLIVTQMDKDRITVKARDVNIALIDWE